MGDIKKITLSTWCTLLRIILSPVIAVLFKNGYSYASFVCFVIASFTDVCDGALARLRNEQTVMGAWLDPVADKILLVTCLFMLTSADTITGAIPYWLACLVLTKELLLLLGVVSFYMWHGCVDIRPTFLSKVTTALQVCFIGMCFISSVWGAAFKQICDTMCPIVATMVLLSLLQYMSIGLCVRKKI